MEDLEPVPGTLRVRREYTRDEMAVNHTAWFSMFSVGMWSLLRNLETSFLYHRNSGSHIGCISRRLYNSYVRHDALNDHAL